MYSYYNDSLLTDTVTATVWSFMLGNFVCVLCKSLKADENRVWTETVNCCQVCFFTAAVNIFSDSSAQYHIVAAFLYFTMLQAVQSVQCTVGQKEFHQNSSMLHLMEAAKNKTKSPQFCSPCIQNAYHFFTNIIIFCLKMETHCTTCT